MMLVADQRKIVWDVVEAQMRAWLVGEEGKGRVRLT